MDAEVFAVALANKNARIVWALLPMAASINVRIYGRNLHPSWHQLIEGLTSQGRPSIRGIVTQTAREQRHQCTRWGIYIVSDSRRRSWSTCDPIIAKPPAATKGAKVIACLAENAE